MYYFSFFALTIKLMLFVINLTVTFLLKSRKFFFKQTLRELRCGYVHRKLGMNFGKLRLFGQMFVGDF